MNAICEISLTKGKVALVDAADAECLMAFKWQAVNLGNTWYAYKAGGMSMHQFLMGITDKTIDHKDGNGLNNCRSNLRYATRSQQGGNKKKSKSKTSSRFKGVYKRSTCSTWYTMVQIGGKTFSRSAKTEEEAAYLYNELAREHFGDFARLNEL